MPIILVYIYNIDFLIHQTQNIAVGDITISFPIQYFTDKIHKLEDFNKKGKWRHYSTTCVTKTLYWQFKLYIIVLLPSLIVICLWIGAICTNAESGINREDFYYVWENQNQKFSVRFDYSIIQSRFKSRLFGLHVFIAFFRK